MREYVVNRPDEAAMRRILERERTGPEGVVLRLAWLEGLSREEIAALTWDQVSFLDDRLELPDRMVPLAPELRTYLWRLHEAHAELSPHVVLSSRAKTPLKPESISRLARLALDREGQTAVRLMDLRHDWIIRQLADKDWPTVARISGVEVPALQARFAAWVPEKKNTAWSGREPMPQVDEFKLWKVLQAERDTPAGLALWLAWQMGLQAQEIVALTWDQVDFDKGIIRLEDRAVPFGSTVRRLLRETWESSRDIPDSHVLLTPNSKKPMDQPRLSKLVRTALIRGGLEDVTLRDLNREEKHEREDGLLLRYAAEKGAITRREVMDMLGLQKVSAYERLRRLTEQRKLVRVGSKYYLTGTVVPPEEQYEVVRRHLEQVDGAYRQELAELLHVEARQCTLILKHMVEEGKLVQLGQRYFLPSEEPVSHLS